MAFPDDGGGGFTVYGYDDVSEDGCARVALCSASRADLQGPQASRRTQVSLGTAGLGIGTTCLKAVAAERLA